MQPDSQRRSDTANKIGIVIVHGVADAEQGANLDTLVETMHENTQFRFEPATYDEIHRLPDIPMGPGDAKTRPVIVRHGSIGTREITFAEVYWADTTRVSNGKFAALIAAFRIIFEAHYFIDALIDRGARKWQPADVLARLLYAATALIRGPIAGANIALLSIAAVYLYGQSILQYADTQSICGPTSTNPQCVVVGLSIAVLSMMCALAAGSAYMLVKSRAAGDIAVLEVSVWTTTGITAAALALGLLVLSDSLYGTVILKSLTAESYAHYIFWPMKLAWLFFGAILISAAGLTLLLVLCTRNPQTRRALWLALILVILQASLWSLFISVPSVPLLALGKFTSSVPPEVHDVAYGFALNYVGLGLVAIIAITVVLPRIHLADLARPANPRRKKQLAEIREIQATLHDIAQRLPRLVLNRNIVAAIVTAGLGNLGLQLVLWKHETSLGALFGSNLHVSLIVILAVTAIVLLLYTFIDHGTSVNFIHIARDLIDHHFQPRLSFVRQLLPARVKATRYPRRKRLLSRLESVVKFLEVQGGCRAIVFVAHSQGSIIVFEYLKRLRSTNRRLASSCSVVTFGSPLEHLYAHYFHHYSEIKGELGQLQAHVASWTNLYRVDDPIGNSIAQYDGWVINIAMESGGHTNYWREPAVAQTIEQSLIQLATATSSTAVAS